MDNRLDGKFIEYHNGCEAAERWVREVGGYDVRVASTGVESNITTRWMSRLETAKVFLGISELTIDFLKKKTAE